MELIDQRLTRVEKVVDQLVLRMDNFEFSLDSKLDRIFNKFVDILDERITGVENKLLRNVGFASSSSSSDPINSDLSTGISSSHSPSLYSEIVPKQVLESDSPLVSSSSQFFADLTSVKAKPTKEEYYEKPSRRDSIEVPGTVLKFFDDTGIKKSVPKLVSTTIGYSSITSNHNMVINIASFDKRLDSSSLKKYLDMKQAILEYNNMYSQNLRMSQVLSSSLLQKIFAQFPRSLGSYNDNVKLFIQSASDSDVEFYVSRLELPTSTAKYCSIIKDCCKFAIHDDFNFTMTDFKDYYQATILYGSKFIEVWQLLELCRSEEYIRAVGTLIIPNLYKANSEVHLSGNEGNSRVSLVNLLTFGDLDKFYERFPNTEKLLEASGKNGLELLEELNENLQSLRKRSKEFEQSLLNERNTPSEIPTNVFQIGDFVFQIIREKLDVPSLHSSRRGPYRIAGHTGTNKYSVFDLIDHVYYDFDVRELIIFSGSPEEALELAKRDKDDYTIERILGYTGTPLKRSEMQFLVKFVSGTIMFLDYRAVVTTAAFGDFITGNYYLGILLLPSQNISGNRSLINKAPSPYAVGYKFYLNVRAFGAVTYSTLECFGIERYQKDYFFLATVADYIARSKNRKLNIYIAQLRLNFEADGYFMHMHGRTIDLPDKGILVSDMMVKKFGLKSKLKVVEDESKKAETLF